LKVTAWPTAEGSGVSPVIAVVVVAGFTVCATPAEILPAKFASPPYVAVSVLAPAVIGVSVQLPAATVPTQLTVPSLTVTVPLGVPPADVTVKLTTTPWPTTEGSGVSPVIAVVVAAAFTAWASATDTLPAKFPSPAYVAVKFLAPAVVGLRVQPAAATLALQLWIPSLTVTVPVGVPLPGPVTVTL
jgi:hypothetical protein